MTTDKLKNGDRCLVIGGTHKGKSGVVQDVHLSNTGHITITVMQVNGVRFKTLGKNVTVKTCKKWQRAIPFPSKKDNSIQMTFKAIVFVGQFIVQKT